MKKVDAPVLDVLGNVLNPPMKVLTDSEKKKIFSQYGIDETQIPRILATDVAASSLSAKVGDVIKIQRNDGTGQYNSYRIVVSG